MTALSWWFCFQRSGVHPDLVYAEGGWAQICWSADHFKGLMAKDCGRRGPWHRVLMPQPLSVKLCKRKNTDPRMDFLHSLAIVSKLF